MKNNFFKKNSQSISAIVIAKNEESMIANCLETLKWCDQIIVVDSGSSDSTVQIAESAGARVISLSHPSFATLRNEGLKRAKTDWVIYIDADERISPKLYQEIMVQIEIDSAAALSMKRQNVLLGKTLWHGGWEEDYVTRIFKRNKLKGWTGRVHESPEYDGESVRLKTPLLHLTHRSVSAGLLKTMDWTKIEAELLSKSEVAPVKFKTIVRKGLVEFWRRAVKKRGYRDGIVGLIEALMQMINKILTYIQLWEFQQSDQIEKSYKQFEKDTASQWDQYHQSNK